MERELAENLLFSHPPKMCPPTIRTPRCCGTFRLTGASRARSNAPPVNQHYIAAIAEHFRTATKKEKARAAGLATGRAAGELHHRRNADGLIADLEKSAGKELRPWIS